MNQYPQNSWGPRQWDASCVLIVRPGGPTRVQGEGSLGEGAASADGSETLIRRGVAGRDGWGRGWGLQVG